MQAFSVLIRLFYIENILMKERYRYILGCTVLLVVAMIMGGCSNDEEPRFIMPVEVPVFFPSEFNTIETHTIELFSVPNQIQTWLSQNGITVDEITSIVAGRGQFVPITSGIQYRLLNNMVINVSPIDSETDINEMYYNDFVEFDHSGNLELLSSISELKDIMVDGVFDLQVKYTLRQSLLTPTEHVLRFDLLIYD